MSALGWPEQLISWLGSTIKKGFHPDPAPTETSQPSFERDGVYAPSPEVRQQAQEGMPALRWSFDPRATYGDRAYDASGEKGKTYNLPRIRDCAPAMWETYGGLFKKVGMELDVDPYALAAYCVFESFNGQKGNYNPRMLDKEGGLWAAGIAATQVQNWAGRQIPGLDKHFPESKQATSDLLRDNPEYGIRCLASIMKHTYESLAADGQPQDLAKAFPLIAYPAWGPEGKSRGSYGSQPQYASRAHAVYEAFVAADGG